MLCETQLQKIPDALKENTEEFVTDGYPENIKSCASKSPRPVVVGFGPCGMFCALLLALKGFAPIVLERGDDADKRAEKIARFCSGKELDEESNIQFGEGGAGTFSDGKLLTRINDPRCAFVIQSYLKHGAPPDIAVNARPHLGTDKLPLIIKSIRNEIISLGGEIRFGTRLDSIAPLRGGYELCAGSDSIFTDSVFIAVGHSAHGTIRMLGSLGMEISAKDCSVGFRIEHTRAETDTCIYRGANLEDGGINLPPAEYNLAHHINNRGVYTFCMCPGGTVTAAASENGHVVTNGMSEYARDGINSNCAVAVSVKSSDFNGNPFAAMEFRENMERGAFSAGGGGFTAPCQRLGDFLDQKVSTEFGSIMPTYPLGVRGADLGLLFPAPLAEALRIGLRVFGTRYSFFKNPDAPLTGVETRTSSPVRISRDDMFFAVGPGGMSFKGIYPCGEGAGYAGGITSAACDGLRAAEKYIDEKSK